MTDETPGELGQIFVFLFVFVFVFVFCILYFVFVSSEIILDRRHLVTDETAGELGSIARKNFTGHCAPVTRIEHCFIPSDK